MLQISRFNLSWLEFIWKEIQITWKIFKFFAIKETSNNSNPKKKNINLVQKAVTPTVNDQEVLC